MTTNPTAPLDPLVASTLDTHTLKYSTSDPDSDTDSLLDALSDSPAFAAHRAARIQQLSSQLALQKSLRQSGHGAITTCADEKQVMDIVTAQPSSPSSSSNRTLCHFFHPGFHRCSIMDNLLEQLVAPHVEVRFLRVEAGKAEWLCTRLGVRVLPCLVGWVDGEEVGRCVGFEGVRGGDGGGVGALEGCLVEKGVLVRVKVGEEGGVRRREREVREKEEEDEGDDWD